MPKSLLVVGSGAIGIEFASFFRTLGSEVTVVEVLPQILPVEDAEIAAFARKALRAAGHQDPHRRQGRRSSTRQADGVTATIDDGKGGTQTLAVERVISAVGVVGNVENLGLEKLGVKIERGTIVIDGYGRTNVPGIYAIGDVAGPPMLAHKAEHEGVVCVEAIKGLQPASARQAEDSRLHLLQPADRQRRPHRGRRPRRRAARSRSAASRSRATARRSRSARTRGWSRPSSTPRPASCSARTWSAPR